MRGFALAACLLIGVAVVTALEAPKLESELDAAHEWSEPEYAEEPAMLETSGKLRGIPVTVHPRKGMVTYISPAKRVQPFGFVMQPPPSVQIVHSHPPPVRPVIVTPLVTERVIENVNPILGHSDGLHEVREFVHPHFPHVHRHRRGLHLNEVPFWSPHDHWPNGHDHHDMDWKNGGTLNMHRHHRHVHPTSRPAHFGPRRFGWANRAEEIVHTRLPVGVPSSLFAQPGHQRHYGHNSHSLSHGAITIPAGPVTVESPDFTGYNRGFPIQTHSSPTAYWSDGQPHHASMTQYG